MCEIKKDDQYSDDSLFNIASWGADMTFRELVQMYEDGDLEKPEFQRNYVWGKMEASRFIESVLLGLPVPSVFLASATDDKRLIIDGYQRIMTMHDYILKKKFGSEETLFRLSNSPGINERWRNKSFDELSPSDQRRIKQSTIHAIIFEQRVPKDDDTSMFQIFERINTSGRTLNAQEIRNCVCQGAFNALLMELNRDSTWRKLFKAEQPDARMLDIELILRFFAIRDLDAMLPNKKQINLRKYLDVYMRFCPLDSLDSKRTDFLRMIRFVFERFGEDAFVVPKSKKTRGRTRLNPVAFESIAVAADAFLRGKAEMVGECDLKDRKLALFTNDEYQVAAKFRTTNIANIDKRIKLAKQILFPETV